MFRFYKRPLPAGTYERIVLVQLGRLGDVVASRSVMHAFAGAYPHSSIEWLVPADSAPLFDTCKPAARVHGYRTDSLYAVVSMLRTLRRPPPDPIVDLTGSPPARWLCLASGARHRAGWGRSWLYAHGTPDQRRKSENYTSEMLRLARSVGAESSGEPPPLSAPPAPKDLAQLLERLDSKSLVVLHPGASNPIRLWRGLRFARLAERLGAIGASVLLVAGPEEATAAAVLAEACRAPLPLYVAADILGLAAALAAGRLFIGLDSGPLHLACALGIPAIGLFGPNLPGRAAPHSPLASTLGVPLPCRPCNQVLADCVLPDHNCMDRIEVEAVLQRASALLRAS